MQYCCCCPHLCITEIYDRTSIVSAKLVRCRQRRRCFSHLSNLRRVKEELHQTCTHSYSHRCRLTMACEKCFFFVPHLAPFGTCSVPIFIRTKHHGIENELWIYYVMLETGELWKWSFFSHFICGYIMRWICERLFENMVFWFVNWFVYLGVDWRNCLRDKSAIRKLGVLEFQLWQQLLTPTDIFDETNVRRKMNCKPK